MRRHWRIKDRTWSMDHAMAPSGRRASAQSVHPLPRGNAGGLAGRGVWSTVRWCSRGVLRRTGFRANRVTRGGTSGAGDPRCRCPTSPAPQSNTRYFSAENRLPKESRTRICFFNSPLPLSSSSSLTRHLPPPAESDPMAPLNVLMVHLPLLYPAYLRRSPLTLFR